MKWKEIMKHRTILGLASIGILLAIGITRAQTKPSAPVQKQTFAIIYQPGPNWIQGHSIFEQDLMPHGQYMQKLLKDGTLEMGGPFSDGSGGMAIINVADADEAQKILANDPSITMGVFTAKLRPWYVVFRAGGQ
jgi:uncharacterized protein YciI